MVWRDDFPGGSTAPDPQASRRVDILSCLYTSAACVAGQVTVTTSRESSRYRYHGNWRINQLALDREHN